MPAPANLVRETSTSTGTGDFTLSPVTGARTFDSAFGTGATPDVFDYFISSRSENEWEIGTGHCSAANTLVRDTVVYSSNANAAVNFSIGTKDVVNDTQAAKQVVTDLAQTLTNKTFDKVTVTAGTTSKPQFSLASGVAPSSPADGDLWYDGTHLQFRLGTRTAVLEERDTLAADRDYYISNAGSDANDGSIGNPWATLQHASDFIRDNITLNSHKITINVADGTYAGVVWVYPAVVGTGHIVWLGNNTTPANVVLTSGFHSNNGQRHNAAIWVSGFKFGGTNQIALDIDDGSILLGEPTFLLPTKNIFACGSTNGAVWIGNVQDNTVGQSEIDLNAIMTSAGSINYFWASQFSASSALTTNNGTSWLPSYNVTGTATFGGAFILANGGIIYAYGPLSGTFTIHGKRYIVGPLGYLITNDPSNFGDQPGTVAALGVLNNYTFDEYRTGNSPGYTRLIDKGSVGTGTVTFVVGASSVQKLTVTGALTIAFTNWAENNAYSEIKLQLVNPSTNITWPTINWLAANGTTSTTPPTLLTTGTNVVTIWSTDNGATLYGSVP